MKWMERQSETETYRDLVNLLFGAIGARADIQYNAERNVVGATAVGFIRTDGTTGNSRLKATSSIGTFC
jgi:hypothetical protein